MITDNLSYPFDAAPNGLAQCGPPSLVVDVEQMTAIYLNYALHCPYRLKIDVPTELNDNEAHSFETILSYVNDLEQHFDIVCGSDVVGSYDRSYEVPDGSVEASNGGIPKPTASTLIVTNTHAVIMLRSVHYDPEIEVSIAGLSVQHIRDLAKGLIKTIPSRIEAPDGLIEVSFWTQSSHGASRRTRRIDALSWDKIAPNYSSKAQKSLEELVQVELADANDSGKLILWHGPPGTGKTTAIRSLTKEWSKWCDVHYIVDPERFFGSSPEYMMDVVMSACADTKNWNLIVLEDAGELISASARQETGQGFSRLLNLCDGLVGRGLKLMVLITTNEKIGNLNQAAMRPGRCIANIEIGPLKGEEASEWLAAHGVELNEANDILEGHSGSLTVAELYEALKETGKVIKSKEKSGSFGF